MKIPLSIVASDLITGRSIHFTDGEIAPPLRGFVRVSGALSCPSNIAATCLADGFLNRSGASQKRFARWAPNW